MTPHNPSEAAREAVDKISANDELVRGGWMPIGKFKAAEIIQSALDSALSASAARVNELEALCDRVANLKRLYHNHNVSPEHFQLTIENISDDASALSIKVGET